MSWWRISGRVLGAVLIQGLFLFLAALLVLLLGWSPRLRLRLAAWWARVWARVCCWLLNIHIRLEGEPLPPPPVLVVANHVGCPDIFVLGALFPGFFVAKLDVRGWPLLGWMIRVGGAVFVDRTRRTSSGRMVEAIETRLRLGFNVIMFPEGTATDGRTILPFKTPGFEAALRADCPVQPVVLTYQETGRPSVAVWGATTFSRHLWSLLRHPRLRVTAHILPPLSGGTRRHLAQQARDRMLEVYHRQGKPP